eukprot:2627871-Amphidinium_carterae.1
MLRSFAPPFSLECLLRAILLTARQRMTSTRFIGWGRTVWMHAFCRTSGDGVGDWGDAAYAIASSQRSRLGRSVSSMAIRGALRLGRSQVGTMNGSSCTWCLYRSTASTWRACRVRREMRPDW